MVIVQSAEIKMANITESTVEVAALSWFDELGYAVAHGLDLSPGEAAAERASFSDVVLVGRLREAIDRLNPTWHGRLVRDFGR